jgi:hypothetical protein
MNILVITKFVEFIKQIDGIRYVDFIDSIDNLPDKSYDLIIVDYNFIINNEDFFTIISNTYGNNCKIWVYCKIEELNNIIKLPIDDFILRPSSSIIIDNKLYLYEKLLKKSHENNPKITAIHNVFANLLTKLAFMNQDKTQEKLIKILINIWHALLIFDYKSSNPNEIKQFIDNVKEGCNMELQIDKIPKYLLKLIIIILCLCPKYLKITNDYCEIMPKINNDILIKEWKNTYIIDNNSNDKTIIYFNQNENIPQISGDN